MGKNKHCIQIVTLQEEKQKQIIKTVGFLFIEDKNQVVFNPCIKDYEKGHWTWHKDGKVHSKDNKGKQIHAFKRIPLSKFKGTSQFLFWGFIKDSGLHKEYKLCEDSAIFMIDLRQFDKGLGLSVHVCDYQNVNKTMKTFEEKLHHQSFIYWKSNPKIVLIAFDN